MEKEIPLDVSRLITDCDKYKLEEYLPYLKCNRCLIVMIDPKNCPICNINLCFTCHKNNCKHQLVQSRHLKSILEGLTFRCKFPKCDKMIRYMEIRSHLQTCEYYDKDVWNRDNKSTSENIPNINIYNENIFNKSISIYNSKEYEGILSIVCNYCNLKFEYKENFIEHLKLCQDVEENSSQVSDYKEKILSIQNKYFNYNSEKLKENLIRLRKILIESSDSIKVKKNNIIQLDTLILKYSGDEFTKNEREFMDLNDKEKVLLKERDELKNKLITIENEYKEKINYYKNLLEGETKNYKDTLIILDIEERWIREELESTIFTSVGDLCTLCGDKDSTKFFCQECQGKYCINKCAKSCQNNSCSKGTRYICPKDGKPCGLCQKHNYCDSCKKSCFYQNCPNLFCPECYKKNEHQARSATINCRFFTCEKDQATDCLMTSIYCSKCEKRLCNKCLLKDIDHHQFIKR